MLTPLQRERLERLRREQDRSRRIGLRLPVGPSPSVHRTDEQPRNDENRRGVEEIDFSI